MRSEPLRVRDLGLRVSGQPALGCSRFPDTGSRIPERALVYAAKMPNTWSIKLLGRFGLVRFGAISCDSVRFGAISCVLVRFGAFWCVSARAGTDCPDGQGLGLAGALRYDVVRNRKQWVVRSRK